MRERVGVHQQSSGGTPQRRRGNMILLGIVLLIIGFVAKVAILWSLGILVLVIGAVLMVLGSMGRAVGGRRHYY
jgi:uncharacterized membrane protein HdeD (DUF308 family)